MGENGHHNNYYPVWCCNRRQHCSLSEESTNGQRDRRFTSRNSTEVLWRFEKEALSTLNCSRDALIYILLFSMTIFTIYGEPRVKTSVAASALSSFKPSPALYLPQPLTNRMDLAEVPFWWQDAREEAVDVKWAGGKPCFFAYADWWRGASTRLGVRFIQCT